ncbi:type VI secretion protein [Shewanella olleyana]|uniref:type VI secretion protein n=1 Tax=Shewanella olleyana TaxID=135626 RepID=UPI002010409A|nr:type VI secretion protein [Shewanella olleyana]MCL1068866.1 type VI secretion protein [Shewanella olleyana]
MRLTLVATFALALSTQAHASVEQQLADCASQTDKLDRLMCYDALAAKVTSSTSVPAQLPASAKTATAESNSSVVTTTAATVAAVESAAVTAPTSPQAMSTAEQEFGLKQKSAEEEQMRLYAEVTSVEKDPYGALIVKLSNSQTWKQVGTDRYKLKVGQTIYIKKGALSSFILGSDERNSTIRVKRLN